MGFLGRYKGRTGLPTGQWMSHRLEQQARGSPLLGPPREKIQRALYTRSWLLPRVWAFNYHLNPAPAVENRATSALARPIRRAFM
jgi:hypothetical protein